VDEGADLVGRVIAGKYAVQSVIGSGAMGTVYRARQMALDKTVALKVLNRELRDDAEFVARFHTEARAASRLDHPNSTRVLDFGEEPDGLLYIAMELLTGRTLGDVIANEFPLAPGRVASLMSQALSAVGAAHGLGIVHRDLKPENIVVLAGKDDEDHPIDVVKVCDFGIAKLDGAYEPGDSMRPTMPVDAGMLAADAKMRNATRAGTIVGTPQYMSPEQARGDKLDVRSDLYSLGVVLYELLTRRAPFDEGTPAEVLHHHVFTHPKAPSELAPNVDPDLEAICVRALQKDREHRFASAREMRRAFRSILDDPARAVTPPPAPSLPRLVDAGAPTISATAVATQVKPARRSRIVWVLPMLGAAGIALFAVSREWTPVRPVRAAATPPTATHAVVAASAPETSAAPPPPVVAEIEPSATAVVTPVVRPHVHEVQPTPSVAELAQTASSAPAETIAPPPTATVTPPPPPATTAVAPPPVVHADPARVHVDLGTITADRVTVTSVESALRHVDFTSCFRAEVEQHREADGDATLVLETDEQRVTRADLVGGAFSPALRQCVSRRTLGARIRDADTGGASAKARLRFVLR